MEDKIEVGEYVRLDNGNIGKVIVVEKGSIMLDIASNRWVGICCIVKHSKNIIGLIEVGDYVNGHKIIMDLEQSKKHYNSKDDFITAVGYTFEENEIKSIVTKEQFESIEYKV